MTGTKNLVFWVKPSRQAGYPVIKLENDKKIMGFLLKDCVRDQNIEKVSSSSTTDRSYSDGHEVTIGIAANCLWGVIIEVAML